MAKKEETIEFGERPSADRFVVATYNVHRCVGLDRREDPERVAKVIREIDADVIGLHEVDTRADGIHESAQMEYLARATDLAAVAGPTIHKGAGHFGNVLLSRWPILESRQIDLSVPGREPRGAIDALVRIKGRPVRVVVTHLGLAAAERRYQTSVLIERFCRMDAGPLVFLGDINEWLPMSRRLRTLNRCLGRSPAVFSYPSRLPFLALDRIWVRPGEALIHVRVHRTPLSRIASDHLPVVAVVGY